MVVVFDLETTGLEESYCDVIEFSYLIFNNNNACIKGETLYFYYEGMSWSESAYEVHHIPLEFLKQYADKFEENQVKMFAVLNLANICGHNVIKFDSIFARTWLQRMGMPALSYLRMADTMTMFKSLTKKSRIKLTNLQEFLNIPDSSVNTFRDIWFNNGETTAAMSAHNSEWDVTLTALIMLKGINKGFVDFTGDTTPVETDKDLDDYEDMQTLVGLDDSVYVRLSEDKLLAVNINQSRTEIVTHVPEDFLTSMRNEKRLLDKIMLPCDNKVIRDAINKANLRSVDFGGATLVLVYDEEQPEFYVHSGEYTVPLKTSDAVLNVFRKNL